jgi:hypothetical protein
MLKHLTLLTLYCFTSACDGNSSTNSASNTEPVQCPGFSRILGGTFTRTDSTLIWTMELESMPSELTFNRAVVPDNMLDYAWQIDVNADNAGIADLMVSAQHFKEPGKPEKTSNDIVGMIDHDLMKIDVAANQANSIGSFDVTLEGNQFTFSLPIATATELETVTSSAQSTWISMYRYGAVAEFCIDTWP